MSADVGLRAVTPGDEDFLVGLYGTTRPEVGMFGWDAAEQDTFIRMQFEMQTRSYAMHSPNAEHSVITYRGASAGRLVIDRRANSISLTDIAIAPEFRRRGIAKIIIGRLQDEAARTGRSIVLTVERTNAAAIHIYRGYDFEVTGEDQIHLTMRWTPPAKEMSK